MPAWMMLTHTVRDVTLYGIIRTGNVVVLVVEGVPTGRSFLLCL
jgi:hypothetical protein